MADQEAQKLAYEFLVARLDDRKLFTVAELQAVTGWKPKSVRTYLSKQLGQYLTRVSRGNFRVKRSFRRFATFADLQPLVTQVRRQVTQYERNVFDAVVSYEFLLPLTQEGKLRAALDDLFYSDTINDIVRDLAEEGGLDAVFPKEPGEGDEPQIVRAVDSTAALFGGYSISHVSGRFRAGPIASREEAARRLMKRQRYLVDETTALVRFLFPCSASKTAHGDRFKLGLQPVDTDAQAAVTKEILAIREIFFAVFVDAVVKTVQGEDIIWLLEDSPLGHRLYELGRANEEAVDTDEGEAPENEDDE